MVLVLVQRHKYGAGVLLFKTFCHSTTSPTMATAPHTKTRYNDVKDVSLVDFLDVETERTLPAHEIWKDQPAVVIGMRTSTTHDMRASSGSLASISVCTLHTKDLCWLFDIDK